MASTAKLFIADGCQAVRLPDEFRFGGSEEVFIRRDPKTGDVVLSSMAPSWTELFARLDASEIPPDFMTEADRDLSVLCRDPLWCRTWGLDNLNLAGLERWP